MLKIGKDQTHTGSHKLYIALDKAKVPIMAEK